MIEIVSLVTLIVAALYVLVRNKIVYEIRTAILWNYDGIGSKLYDALPSYEAMIFNPRHMFRVTTAQWVAYADAMLRERAK